MILRFLWALVLFLLGLSAVNNYFSILPEFIFLDNKLLMLLNGTALIIAGLIIFVQKILLRFHKAF